MNFSPHSSSSSDLQVESRERSQGKPRTSKFLMVRKLDFDVSIPNTLIFLYGW